MLDGRESPGGRLKQETKVLEVSIYFFISFWRIV